MKNAIEGFSQEYALSLNKVKIENGKEKIIKLDCNDLLILRWFVDFYPKMIKIEIEGKQYAWVKYQTLLDDLPLLDIKKRMLFERLQKLVEFKILTHKSINNGGSFSYYGFGENYIKLVDTSFSKGMQNNAEGYAENYIGVCNKLQRGMQNNANQINSSIKDNSIKDNKYIAEQVLCYLNEKSNKHYKAIDSNIKFITARLKDYNEADLKAVIDKKVAEWKGTDMERFLRPETLFNATKFESYVNAPLRKVVKGDETQHFDGEREYSKQEIQNLMTDIDDIDF